MSDDYTYTLLGVPSQGPSPIFATRHEAIGEKAILEGIHQCDSIEVTTRKRYATDPV